MCARPGVHAIGHGQQSKYFCGYDRLVARAARLNPSQPKGAPPARGMPKAKVPKPARRRSPALALVKRLRECREEVLRFMTNLSIPLDNTGVERDLWMIKLQQKSLGLLPDGGRGAGILSDPQLPILGAEAVAANANSPRTSL